jgi:ankyrin repeat protein
MLHKQKLTVWGLALTLSLLGILTGCNKSTETRLAAPKTTPQLTAMEVALLQAAAGGDTPAVKDLLVKGLNVNLKAADGRTPLTEAAYAGHLDTIRVLLDHGADLSAKKRDGESAITLGARHSDVSELFKNVGVLVEAASSGNTPVVKELIAKGIPLNGLDQYGHTALTEACWNGRTDTVKLLLEKGADANIKKSDGETPLSLAAGQKHEAIVALLNEAMVKRSKATPAETSK